MASKNISKKDKPQVYTQNGLTIEEEQEILKASEEADRGINVSGPYTSVDEMFEDLKK